MKNFTFLLFLFFSTIINSQVDPDWFNQDWYLYEVYDSDFEEVLLKVEGYNIYGDPYNISPYVHIESNLAYHGVGICDTFEGVLQQDPLNLYWFAPNELEITDISCEIPDMDEEVAIGPFGEIPLFSEDYNILLSYVTDDSDGFQSLSMTTQPFIGYHYRNTTVLSNGDFNKTQFSVYPNPTDGRFNISSPNYNAIKSVSVYSEIGTLITSKDELPIDITAVMAGVYYIEIQTMFGKEVHKIIKN